MTRRSVRVSGVDQDQTAGARNPSRIRLVTVALAILIAAFTTGTPPASAATAGTVLLARGAWAGGLGVNVYSNGGSTSYNGGINSVYNPALGKVVNTGSRWQCVELINRLYSYRGWTKSYWSGDGGDKYDTALSVGLKRQLNYSISYLRPGDVVVLQQPSNPYGHGHAAVVDTVSGSQVRIVNQNLSAGVGTQVYTYASWNGSRLTVPGNTPGSPWGGWSVKGVVHHP